MLIWCSSGMKSTSSNKSVKRNKFNKISILDRNIEIFETQISDTIKKIKLSDKKIQLHYHAEINVFRLLTIHQYNYSEYESGKGLTQVFSEVQVLEMLS